MVRFSCFPTPIHYNKSKKSVQQFAETINTNSQGLSQHRVTLDSSCSAASNPHLKAHKSNNSETSAEQNLSSSSFESSWKLGEMNNKFSPDDSGEALRKGLLRKSQSLGSGLDRERSMSTMDLEDDAEIVADKYVHNVNVDLVNPEAHFFIGDSSQFEEVLEVTGARISGGSTGDYAHLTTSVVPFMVVNSISQPNLRDIQGDGSPAYGKTRSKSFDNIIARDERNSVYETDGDTFPSRVISYRSRSASSCHNMLQTSVSLEKREECVLSNRGGASFEIADYEQDDKCQNQFIDGNDSCNCSDLLHGWAHLEQEEVDDGHDHRAEMQDSLSCRDYNMKRIEEWVNRIDLQNNLPLQEIGESSNSASKRDSSEVDGEGSVKLDSRFSPGMEVANNYISSLTPTTSSAQMANLGLAVIPFLSAFVSLRVLNLSGNAIVRITAGTLPRGLHVLNLSKNYICAIEGLRELSRLRILDLSYNRICRIGHGLASCTALKELYLAGNKISEVEGLHRLLKLAIVDLRFNKISTTKCLGQLAANYNSMQAINLEGNPAQRNVGDEQLRKYLLGLLPNLVYFNKQTIRNSSSKEVSDRHVRSMTVSPFDRGARAEHKPSRRISHGGATHKAVLFSSGHGRAVGSPKRSKGRHVRNPLSGLRGANHQLDIGSKVLSLQSLQSIRRSRSEGTFTLLAA